MEETGPAVEMQALKVDKASKWTIYFLVDLRVVFIITFVYISVVNLISTTANVQATTHAESTAAFNVTSNPEHVNVSVSFIDDALLWNCRKQSETKVYYEGLYWMLVAAFIVTLLSLAIAKCVVIYGASHEDKFLKRIAIMQCLQEKEEQSKCISQPFKEKCKKFLMNPKYDDDDDDDEDDNDRYRRNTLCRKLSLLLSITIITTSMILGGLFYDLHLLSCILEPSEDFIDYNTTTQTVELRYSENLSRSQTAVGVISLLLGIGFLLNCFLFYFCTFRIVNSWKEKLIMDFE